MIFSILAFIALIISICIKDRTKSLRVQSINCLLEAIYALYIKAFTGGFLGIINFIRSYIFIHSEKINKKVYLGLLIMFEIFVITNCIYTWNGFISIFPTIASIIRTYCLWQTNMKYVRMSGIITGIFFGIYYLFYQSWFIVIGYIILLIMSIVSTYKNDIKKKRN